jgi:two-component system phosphate regulon response regulator PhoB
MMNQARKETVRAWAASAPRILIVEDESDLALLLGYNLESEGYVVENVARGDEAELRLAENAPDLVILDWMLPGVSGLEICRRLRAREATRTLPVIMVTARGEEAERVRGLSVGADDYVVKPFSVPELMARVRALLRRSRPERIAERLYAGDLDLDRETRRVRRGARDIHLGPTEFRLLEYLLEKPGRVFSCAQLLDAVWGAGGGDRRAHRRRSRRAAAQGALAWAGTRSDPHRSRRRLRLRRDLREGLRPGYADCAARRPFSRAASPRKPRAGPDARSAPPKSGPVGRVAVRQPRGDPGAARYFPNMKQRNRPITAL